MLLLMFVDKTDGCQTTSTPHQAVSTTAQTIFVGLFQNCGTASLRWRIREHSTSTPRRAIQHRRFRSRNGLGRRGPPPPSGPCWLAVWWRGGGPGPPGGLETTREGSSFADATASSHVDHLPSGHFRSCSGGAVFRSAPLVRHARVNRQAGLLGRSPNVPRPVRGHFRTAVRFGGPWQRPSRLWRGGGAPPGQLVRRLPNPGARPGFGTQARGGKGRTPLPPPVQEGGGAQCYLTPFLLPNPGQGCRCPGSTPRCSTRW